MTNVTSYIISYKLYNIEQTHLKINHLVNRNSYSDMKMIKIKLQLNTNIEIIIEWLIWMFICVHCKNQLLSFGLSIEYRKKEKNWILRNFGSSLSGKFTGWGIQSIIYMVITTLELESWNELNMNRVNVQYYNKSTGL